MKIHINLKKTADNSYDILIGKVILNDIPAILKENSPANNYIIITDSNVKKIYGDSLLKNMKSSGLKTLLISFKAGEQSKNMETVAGILSEMLKNNLDRSYTIIALGGGVVGDIAGFIASIYKRGIPYIQVPTTLVAQIDSSIGGKTGIDTDYGKNTIGTFYQPKKVIVGIDALKTLPKKEFINGLAEAIKCALIKDKDFFNFLEENIDKILSLDSDILKQVIKKSCEIKKEVIEKDEKEKNYRKILNFGHTIGHSLELTSNYEISHGEAVSIGIIAEAEISEEMGLLKKEENNRIKNLLERCNLPISLPKYIDSELVIKNTGLDKKSVKGVPYYVLLEKIGRAKINVKVSDKIVSGILSDLK